MSSTAYTEFLKPIRPRSAGNGFDFHVYYSSEEETSHARTLHKLIQSEFQPEMTVYPMKDKPVGPHPTPMFEVNVFTPHQTGALFSWLAVNRGPCSYVITHMLIICFLFCSSIPYSHPINSVLIHPNTDDELADHTTLATWMGTPLPLKTDIFQHKPRGATAVPLNQAA
ncbi:DOPA-like domain-containing protein [Mycena polygramma]|nr:DOPA-like domain-containing protein [Mycena polygramma]